MLIYDSKLLNTPILSVQTGSPVGYIDQLIIDPDKLQVIAFRLAGPLVSADAHLLDVNSIREQSELGMIIDGVEDLVGDDDIIKISKVLALNFNLIGLKVETKKGSKLGKITDFTMTAEDFTIQQLIVKRPTIKAFLDPELVIPRREIVEITDYKVIVKDEEKVIKARAEKEDFIPNFVNPFRTHEPDYAPTKADDEA